MNKASITHERAGLHGHVFQGAHLSEGCGFPVRPVSSMSAALSPQDLIIRGPTQYEIEPGCFA